MTSKERKSAKKNRRVQEKAYEVCNKQIGPLRGCSAVQLQSGVLGNKDTKERNNTQGKYTWSKTGKHYAKEVRPY